MIPMRVPFVLAVLLLGLAPLPSASAAEAFLTDAVGDVQCVVMAVDTALPGAGCSGQTFADSNDLVSLDIAETADTLDLTLAVKGISGDPQGTWAQIMLSWHSKDYMLEMGRFSSANGGFEEANAYLLADEGGDWNYVAMLEDPIVDTGAGTLRVSLPKVYLLDAQKRIPGKGDAIEITQVVADPNIIGGGIVDLRVRDAMPDEAAAKAYTLTMGDESAGDIILFAEDRVRVSNGGATTFVFKIDVRNPGETDHEYQLGVADMPQGWNATVQSPVRVASKETKTVSVLLSVPFAHEHGGHSAFNLTAASATDAATHAKIRLGVLHTPIPQPAGHHSELYLHAENGRGQLPIDPALEVAFPFGYGWMTTQADHADDFEYVTPNNGGGFLNFNDESNWWIGLDPNLLVGLDFDLARTGTFEGAIVGGENAESEVRANLWYWSEGLDEGLLLAEGEPTAVSLTLQDPTPFSMTMTPTPESDYLAYAPNSYIWLEVSMPKPLQQGATPTFAPKLMVEPFKLALPLNEYHDRLTGVSEAASAIDIIAKGVVEKLGQAGTVLTYAFEVKNPGAADTFVLDLAGNDVDQATLVPRGEIFLEQGASYEVTLAVEIPVEANDGEEFEVLLFVHSRDDPSKMAVARTKTKVTNDASAAMADESATLLAAQARENDTPFPAIPALALVLALALALPRRKR